MTPAGWLAALEHELRARGVPVEDLVDLLAEAESTITEAQEPPMELFGLPDTYADLVAAAIGRTARRARPVVELDAVTTDLAADEGQEADVVVLAQGHGYVAGHLHRRRVHLVGGQWLPVGGVPALRNFRETCAVSVRPDTSRSSLRTEPPGTRIT